MIFSIRDLEVQRSLPGEFIEVCASHTANWRSGGMLTILHQEILNLKSSEIDCILDSNWDLRAPPYKTLTVQRLVFVRVGHYLASYHHN